jgi:hypothetical protein
MTENVVLSLRLITTGRQAECSRVHAAHPRARVWLLQQPSARLRLSVALPFGDDRLQPVLFDVPRANQGVHGHESAWNGLTGHPEGNADAPQGSHYQ